MSHTNTFMLDIETAGIDAGAAILQIACAEFDRTNGAILRKWETNVDALDSAANGMAIACPETARFHLRNGYDATLRGSTLWRALNALDTFLHLHSETVEVWAWGLDFETAHLKAACAATRFPMPWMYYEGRCARTAWYLAFPGQKPPKRPHIASLDVTAQVADLCQALNSIRRKS
jgi:hypothetical protein